MRGLSIIFGFTLLGYIGNHILSIPLPGNVIGLILLTVSLYRGWVRLEWVEDTAAFLLKHMMIFFAPTIVGTIVYFSRIGQEWLVITAGLVVGVFTVLLVTGGVTTLLMKKGEPR